MHENGHRVMQMWKSRALPWNSTLHFIWTISYTCELNLCPRLNSLLLACLLASSITTTWYTHYKYCYQVSPKRKGWESTDNTTTWLLCFPWHCVAQQVQFFLWARVERSMSKWLSPWISSTLSLSPLENKGFTFGACNQTLEPPRYMGIQLAWRSPIIL